MPHRISRRMLIGSFLFVLAGVIVLLTVVDLRRSQTELRRTVDNISTAQTPGSVARLRYQAQQRWLTCHVAERAGTLDSEEMAVCSGYMTLTDAYRTQGVSPP